MNTHLSFIVTKLPLIAFAISLVMAGCQDADQPVSAQSDLSGQSVESLNKTDAPGSRPEYVPGELLVKFTAGSSNSRREAALAKVSAQVGERILTAAMKQRGDTEGILLIRTATSLPAALEALRGLPAVEYAEPNYYYYHDATSNDTYYSNGSLWGMYGATTSPANQYGSQAAAAWATGHTGSASVYIGIIDEGYMYTHEDIAANAGVNPGEIAGNRKDDDGNGYIDDVYGWDFDGGNNSVFDGVTDDHGTHVAGTIGAVGGNGKGVAGMVWNVKIMNAKFLGRNGGTTANAIKAVDYFTDLKKKGVNFVALNNSWGGGGFSQALYDAIERANVAGILFIAAAGNNSSNNDATLSYPASYTNANIIAVASIDSKGLLSGFSNYGASSVDIGAPGSAVWSTVPVSSKGKIVAGYASYSGTSMATPHVTGACALYASTNTGATAAQIKSAILGSAVATASLAGKCATGGRLNAGGF